MSRVVWPISQMGGSRGPTVFAAWRDVWIFMALAYLFSWIWWGGTMGMGIVSPANLSQASGDEAQMAQVLIALGNFGPLLSALIMRLWISREGLRGIMGWRRSWRLYAVAVIAPVIFYAGVALINHLSGIAPFVWANAEMPLWSYLAVELLIGGLIISVFILGEEVGWRGYLLPRLLPLGEVRATVTVGLIWAGWHLPLLAVGLNYPGQSLWLAIPLFTLVVIALSFPLTWFYRITGGSVVLVTLLHGFINSYGDGLTADHIIPTGNPLVTGSAGLLVLVILLLMIGLVYGIFKRPVALLILAGLMLTGLPAQAQETPTQLATTGVVIVVNTNGDKYAPIDHVSGNGVSLGSNGNTVQK